MLVSGINVYGKGNKGVGAIKGIDVQGIDKETVGIVFKGTRKTVSIVLNNNVAEQLSKHLADMAKKTVR